MYQWGVHQSYTEDNWIHINIRSHIRNRLYTYHTNKCHLTLSDQVNLFDQKQKKQYIKFWNSEVFHVPKIIKNCVYNLVGLNQKVCLTWHNLLSKEKKCNISFFVFDINKLVYQQCIWYKNQNWMRLSLNFVQSTVFIFFSNIQMF